MSARPRIELEGGRRRTRGAGVGELGARLLGVLVWLVPALAFAWWWF